MEEKQNMSNAQLEAALSSQRGSITLFKILTYGFAVVTMALFAFGLIPVAIPALVLTFVFGYQMNKRTETVKKLLSGPSPTRARDVRGRKSPGRRTCALVIRGTLTALSIPSPSAG